MWRNAVTVLRLALGGVFIWAGLSKLQHPYDFLEAIYKYELVGAQTGLWIAAILPWLEVGVGTSLVVGVWQLGGAMLSVFLLAVFTFAQVLAASQGLKIPCGCAAGTEPDYVSYWEAVQSGLMLLGAGCVFVGSCTSSSLNEMASKESPRSKDAANTGEDYAKGVPHC